MRLKIPNSGLIKGINVPQIHIRFYVLTYIHYYKTSLVPQSSFLTERRPDCKTDSLTGNGRGVLLTLTTPVAILLCFRGRPRPRATRLT
jgi:hypothetical protein